LVAVVRKMRMEALRYFHQLLVVVVALVVVVRLVQVTV